MSINKDTKLEKGKEKRKTGGIVGLYKYLLRAAKALVVSKIAVENSIHCNITPPLEKLALKLYRYPYLIPMGRSYLYTLLVAYYLHYTSILSIYLGTLVV